MEEKVEERKYSILGGGDIGFPVLLAASVYFSRGVRDGIIVAVFAPAIWVLISCNKSLIKFH